MKKFLLLLSVAMLSLGITAQIAPTLSQKSVQKTNRLFAQKAEKRNISKANSNGFTLQFCGELSSWYYIAQQNKLDYKCYIYIPAEMATMIAGNQITDITFSTTSDFTNAPRSGAVFVAESLDADPVTSTACTMVDCYDEYQKGNPPYQTVKLDEPYTIKENTGFYFGYIVKQCRYSVIAQSADYPVGVDMLTPNGFSGAVDLTDGNGDYIGTFNMADAKTNLFLAATTVGTANGFENIFQIGNMSIGNFTLPVVDKNDAQPLLVPVRNIGGNAITSIEYSIDLNGVAGEVQTMDIYIEPGAETYIEIPAPKYQGGRNNITLHINKLNGIAQGLTSSASCLALANGGFDRKLVVEEGTGTWCGWCPRGIVGLDKMSEKYPDSFIGIAVHSGDNMYAPSYYDFINNYFKSFPNCMVNRDQIYLIDPDFELLDLCMSEDFWGSQRAVAKIDLNVAESEEGFNVTAHTTFDFDEMNANYKLAFVLLEDGIVDTQQNYYSGNANSLEWWDEQGKTVTWTFEHTARDIFNCFGLANSIPATITAGKPMTYKKTLPLTNISDKTKTSVVALLLDTRSNTVLNAAKCDYKNFSEFDFAGIEDIVFDNASATYYNINGMRVEKPAKGSIVICRQGGKTFKVRIEK